MKIRQRTSRESIRIRYIPEVQPEPETTDETEVDSVATNDENASGNGQV